MADVAKTEDMLRIYSGMVMSHTLIPKLSCEFMELEVGGKRNKVRRVSYV